MAEQGRQGEGHAKRSGPKVGGFPREAVFGACAGLAPAEHPFEEGKAPAVMAGWPLCRNYGIDGS